MAKKSRGKKSAARPAAKKSKSSAPARKPAAAAAGRKPPAASAARKGRKSSWLDESNAPMIEKQAKRMKSFMDAMADGRVDAAEVQAQEARLVSLMKEIEPVLDDRLHALVTQLLCELTAYDLMQILHSMEAARPKSVFRG